MFSILVRRTECIDVLLTSCVGISAIGSCWSLSRGRCMTGLAVTSLGIVGVVVVTSRWTTARATTTTTTAVLLALEKGCQ